MKRLKEYRKQWAKILRAVGHSNDVIDTIFDVAAKHRGPEAMTMEDVKRMMMENKRGVEPYAEDDDGEQMSLAVRRRLLMFGLHEKTNLLQFCSEAVNIINQ